MMFFLRKAAIFALLIWFSMPLVSVTETQKTADQFSKKLLSFNSLKGKFKQIIKSDDQVVLQETSGVFYIQKPGLFRWEVNPPYEQLIIGNPETLWVYDPDLEQVNVQVQDGRSVSPSTLLSGDVDQLLKHYRVSSHSEAGNEVFTLIPSNNTPENDEISFSFRELRIEFKQTRLAAMAIIDGLNQMTRIELVDTEKDQTLDPALFSFSPPESVDVIIDR